MAEQKVLREAENTVKIEGIVADIRLETKDVSGKDAITGEIDILVNGDTHTVNVFSYKKNKEGKESGLYKGFMTVKNDYKSIKNNGETEADKVRITQGKVSLNEYVGQDGELKSYPQISTNFINRLSATDEFEPTAEFTLEMVVANVSEEKKNGEETGRVTVKGYVPLYGGVVIPFDVVVGDPKAVNYVSSNYDKGTTVTVHGDIVNKVTIIKKEIEVEFGENKVDTNRTTVREYAVKGGTAPKDEDDEKAYSKVDIKKALVARDKYLEEKKQKKSSNNKSSNNKDPFADYGSKAIDISDDDLPF